MPSPRYHVYLPVALGQQLEALAEESGQGVSATIRRCIELALHSPELRLLLHAESPPVETDTTTVAQRQRWVEYGQGEGFDPACLVTE
jgi:hypothetical protein